MTDDEMRVAIAEAWGFEPGTINTTSWLGYCSAIHTEDLYQLDCDVTDSEEKPDHILAKVPYFIGDLNAMAEAEKMLASWEEREQYAVRLNVLTQGFDHPLYTLLTATARQRAIALLAVKQPSGDGKDK